ncbi:RecQ family ATP-dependent DNA helicase [Rhodopirellula sp. MGV]|uniref:RecQ family ATP-dependent DNA helicase n=1 Tax=Rhodopirellula sp. MGV TaxID=2023130 RepID=UPI000B969B7C|nr:RecQ family ATP-dependent DNA helicase [Rhodopirellula sp. MGV]OYP37081.1 ATP-dependent DNA helicase [Rhodopirellula sp. MGV]PNY36304.1 ATP-dependent DNA helicase RecQ [Rhodopirellula baltica]
MSNDTPQQLLKHYFGYDSFRYSQQAIIDHVLHGEHAMVVMPTGMGKSLCYQIPALVNAKRSPGSLTLVLSPLIALMQDQSQSLTDRGIDATFINSSLDRQTRTQRYERLAKGDYQILYVTPERFRKQEFLDAIAQRDINVLAIDEAHCVSQWGHDFRPDYTRIAEIRERLGNPTTIALTATATSECRADIYQQIGLSADQIKLFNEGIDRPNLKLDVEPVYDESEKLSLLPEIVCDPTYSGGSVIVYFSLIKTLQRFSDDLLSKGVDHVCYHGDLPRNVRTRVQNEFMSGDADLVLATNAFGMGIDKSDIRIVVHAETPGSIEAYYQEIGRAGRDGEPSRCVWLYAQEDLMTQMQFIEWSNPDAAFYTRLHRLLVERGEQCHAYGFDWINEQLQRRSKHDHRLATALPMLDRHGVVKGPHPPACYDVIADLPPGLQDEDILGEKKRRDQQRLYAMVQFAGEEGDRKEFLNRYFG